MAVTHAAGILNDNELHLTEVKGVLSVRPNLTYLDKSDKRAKQEGATLVYLKLPVLHWLWHWVPYYTVLWIRNPVLFYPLDSG
jgi:hypothetical protein